MKSPNQLIPQSLGPSRALHIPGWQYVPSFTVNDRVHGIVTFYPSWERMANYSNHCGGQVLGHIMIVDRSSNGEGYVLHTPMDDDAVRYATVDEAVSASLNFAPL